ncbi:1584_t:CDS:2 [Funneliformis mosseae]|uniref:1584_t:CDS:1 n=1 Tax=Funneliformis mosseae TaxID=27381 RepID=A0A9N9NC98_FUNMO|nr:1584_t:CDS:2 [Funneliformis mosseae]
MESKILEEKAQLQETRNQDHLLRETTARLIEKDLLDESYVKNSGQKRPYFKTKSNEDPRKKVNRIQWKKSDFIPVNLTHFVPGYVNPIHFGPGYFIPNIWFREILIATVNDFIPVNLTHFVPGYSVVTGTGHVLGWDIINGTIILGQPGTSQLGQSGTLKILWDAVHHITAWFWEILIATVNGRFRDLG